FRRAMAEPTDLDPLGRAKPPEPAQVADAWWAVFSVAAGVKDHFDRLCPVWEGAICDGAVPPTVPTRDGPIPIDQLFVSVARGEGPGASEDGRLITLSPAGVDLWIAAGARLLVEHTQTSYDDALDTPGPLTGL